MTRARLVARLRELATEPLPIPGRGQTALRHKSLLEIGREDLSLARLAEAHFDALAILGEAGLPPAAGALYAVWASEKPGEALRLEPGSGGFALRGRKFFASGAGLLDRALVTVGAPEQRLVDVDLRGNAARIQFDFTQWKTSAFAETQTAMALFDSAVVAERDLIELPNWYLERPGFWHGACGPAACWAGGAIGLVDYAQAQPRFDGHTLAHLGAMRASAWALKVYLEAAGHEIDAEPENAIAARIRARTVRHLVEEAASGVLRRLGRAYGPHPLAFDEEISRRHQELDLYLRQWHAERDLEALGRDLAEKTI